MWKPFFNRKYDAACIDESNNWLFWRWYDIENHIGLVYLRRLYLLRTPWFSVMLHRILRPDPDRHLHDHPWHFFSILLRGSYREQRGRRIHHRRWWNFCRAEGAHKITHVSPTCTSLVLTGPKIRSWGFHTETGWVHWRKYAH
jgi:hypothetical protein